ncbi:MAG: sel1 repeat family protein [Alkalimonas sp.]|uniref:Sel1 repeat family protein n=1 Tax=Alkalimonas delamerensis TaxID=265981 RepID=A0ABT9GKS0_9GAMM|nr:tetratricopeptide repeat protein [Alkalimonas delamerensis]MCC5851734.1 sel1 repeat family protein [Alkalimonas sp.]MDP4527570.1 sel1 repeat family protein [Alkalimonas delamerensis]
MRYVRRLVVMGLLAGLTSSVLADEVRIQQLEAVQLYTQDELLALIRTNSHLRQVQDDDCQLVRDIEARADIMKLPSYQFLWGDMLAYAVCVPRDIERGWQLMLDAAAQGLPEGLEQVGRYYHIGRFVQPDAEKAILYLREAAALGNLPATIRLAEILLDEAGSPRDYEQVYRWLHHSVTADNATHQKISRLLRQFEQRMPERVVQRARRPVS